MTTHHILLQKQQHVIKMLAKYFKPDANDAINYQIIAKKSFK